jgi:iron(III) transport system permease protein
VHVVIWLLFLLIVLAPTIWLAADALRADELTRAWPTLLGADQWQLLTRSLILAASAAGVALVLGVPYALLCERTDLPVVPLWRVLGLLPLLIPPFIHGMAWLRLGLPTDGDPWLAQAVGDLLPPVTSTGGAAFVLGLAYLPFVILLTVAGLRGLDHRLEEAGLLRGGPMRVWLGITLPLVRPHVLAGGLFVFVFALVEFAVPDILRVQVYPVEIFIQFSALFDEAAAVALALPLLLITIAAVLAIGWTMRGRAFVSIGAGRGRARRVPLRS